MQHPHQQQHMLQQAMNPRMMQPHRSRSLPKRRPNLRIIEETQNQPLQIFIVELRDNPAQFGIHRLDRKLGHRHKVTRLDLVLRCIPHLRQRVIWNLPLYFEICPCTLT